MAAQLVLAEVKVTNNISGNNRSFLVDPGINVTLHDTVVATAADVGTQFLLRAGSVGVNVSA